MKKLWPFFSRYFQKEKKVVFLSLGDSSQRIVLLNTSKDGTIVMGINGE